MTRFLLCAVVLIGLSRPAMATNFWLSATGNVVTGSAPPVNAGAAETINHHSGTTSGTIFVWARPDSGETLLNWSLRLLSSDSSILTFTSSSVESLNPILGDTGTPDFDDIVRWEFVDEPTGDSSSITDIQGVNIFQVDRTGVGIGPDNTGTPYSDSFYDSVNDAFLLSQIDYTLTGTLGQTNLFLQIGEQGLNNLGQTSSQTSAVLGDLTDLPALNGESGRMQSSVNVDAIISVTNADFDSDSDIDGKDFLTWQRGFGLASPTFAQGDANDDDAVDGLDLTAWEQQFGGPPALSALQTVPEPSGLVLSLVGCFILWPGQRLRRFLPGMATKGSRGNWRRRPLRTYRMTKPTDGLFQAKAVLLRSSLISLLMLGSGVQSRADITVDPNTIGATDVVQDPAGSPMTLTNPLADPLNLGPNALAVGNISLGELGIDNGGQLSNGLGIIGRLNGSTGEVSVVGMGSTWTNSGNLDVGSSGDGTLIIQNGGEVSNTGGFIGSQFTSTSTATVDGPGSTWTNTENLDVGNLGNGTLNIWNGGTVSSSFGKLGVGPGSIGMATVNGPGSTWTNSNDLYVGGDFSNAGGAGSLNVENSGLVNVTGTLKIWSTGTLTLDGGSITTGSLDNLDFGTLNFFDGMLTVNGGTFAPNAGGPTDIYNIDAPTFAETPHLVIDAGGTAILGDDLYVGNHRQGELTISGAGTVSNEDGVIGRLNSSTGTVTVDGASWTNTNNLTVGNSGDGTLNIQNGGSVFSVAGGVGVGSGTGTAIVDGTSTLWSNSGDLSIGAGNGTLVIRNFAVVTSDTTYLGNVAASSGQGTLQLENGGTLDPVASLQIRRTGSLQGSGTVASPVNNDGRIAPGALTGIIFIVGDYTQTTDGVLEIEIGGLTPGTGHDRLDVTGAATLAGRLEVPLIDIGGGTFMPLENDEVVFLTAASVTGTFDSLFSPNLATVNPNLAIQVVANPTDMRIRFVAPSSSNTFSGTATTSNWADTANWSEENVPDSTDIVGVNNLAGTIQRVEVAFDPGIPGSGNAFVHEATVAGVVQPLTLSVKTGSKLSATLGVTVANLGVVELDGGEIVASGVEVEAGGKVTGNGTIVGNLTIGDGGAGLATISPGFSVGQINIEGNYEQQSNSELVIEVEGINPGEFDSIDVSGQATLDGTVEILLDDIADAPVGSVINFITAGGVTGTFDRVITTGVDDYFLAPFYPGGVAAAGVSMSGASAPVAAGAMVFEEGDMDPSVPGLGEEDAAAFALGLTDPDAYAGLYGIDPIESGNIDDDSDFDFDDIQPFVDLLNNALPAGMTMARMMEIVGAAQNPVPEPTGSVLVLCGCFFWWPSRRLRRCPTRLQGVAQQ